MIVGNQGRAPADVEVSQILKRLVGAVGFEPTAR